MSISEVIYTRRKALNMTQKDLAQKLNITDRTISRWECGKSLPDVAMLKTLAEVLGMDVAEFYVDVPKNEINETETVDYERIDQYKRGLILPFLLLVATLVAVPIIKMYFADIWSVPRIPVYDPKYNEYIAALYRKTCIGCMFTLCAFICSLTCMIYGFISFRRFYIRKKSKSIYVGLCRTANIVYIAFALIYIVLFLIDPIALWYAINGKMLPWNSFF